MNFSYRSLPGSPVARPFLDVLVGAAQFRFSALIDSGAVNGLFPLALARQAGIDLSEPEIREVLIGPGQQTYHASFVTVPLEVAGLTWEPEIGFCDWMNPDWGLLGHASFFRWFTVTFRAYDGEFEVEPISA